jgi:23S rRNA pseudouridine1911/1915/1917 synthase
MNQECETIVIEKEEEGERLDKILSRRFDQKYSRTYFQSLIERNLVLLNGEVVKKRSKPVQDDEIEIQFLFTPETTLVPEPIFLDIIYEDEFIIVINKPAGMVVHPSVGHWTGTFVNALLYHCHSLPDSSDLRPGIVHRLDKDTSGVIVAAKTIEAHQKLTAQFAERKVYKQYTAICIGNPSEKRVEEPIGRHPIHRKQMAVVSEGRYAISVFKTIACNGSLSLIEATIGTGRTHQIRVHLQHIKAPILGDALYGNESVNRRYGSPRQLLHASILRFLHPISHQELEFFAPIPVEMQIFVDKLLPNHLL